MVTALAAFVTQAHAAPSEGTHGKVDETPLLDETRSSTQTVAPTATAAPAANPSRAAQAADTPTAPAGEIPPAAARASEPDLKNTVNSLREKLTEMESRVEELTRKLEAKEASAHAPATTKAPVTAKAPAHKAAKAAKPAPAPESAKGGELDSIPLDETPKKIETVSVPTHPGDRIGTPVPVREEPGDPEMGFTNDSTIQEFRSAIILHKAGKYPEAVLAFSAFVENYPDHPLAGTAQFYVGDSYFRQKEYGLAVREFQRVLTTYDRSTHIAQTLREISDSEDALRKSDDAARHRQLLMSLFPHSPFATASTASRGATAPASAPVPASSIQPSGGKETR